MSERTVLVCGATGTQGGAVAEALTRTDGVEVQALTRDPSQPAAEDLERAGASVVEGDLANRERIEEILQDVDAVFGVTNFWEHGYNDEVVHGVNLVEAAQAAGVDHFVFSSVGGAERDTGIPHFDSKHEIEQALQDTGLQTTILRPVFFMQNLEEMREDVLEGGLAMGLARGVPLQMLDVEDLGEVAREAFDDPDEYAGRAIELASDELTLQAMAARIAAVTGLEIPAHNLSIEQVREAMGEEYAVMFDWFNEEGYEADLSQLRTDHDVSFTCLETYLEREGWGKVGA